MAEDTIRVLRIIEYSGPRRNVEEQINRSLPDGTKTIERTGVIIRVGTVGGFPEVIFGYSAYRKGEDGG